jgi:hypothetical protein
MVHIKTPSEYNKRITEIPFKCIDNISMFMKNVDVSILRDFFKKKASFKI